MAEEGDVERVAHELGGARRDGHALREPEAPLAHRREGREQGGLVEEVQAREAPGAGGGERRKGADDRRVQTCPWGGSEQGEKNRSDSKRRITIRKTDDSKTHA